MEMFHLFKNLIVSTGCLIDDNDRPIKLKDHGVLIDYLVENGVFPYQCPYTSIKLAKDGQLYFVFIIQEI